MLQYHAPSFEVAQMICDGAGQLLLTMFPFISRYYHIGVICTRKHQIRIDNFKHVIQVRVK